MEQINVMIIKELIAMVERGEAIDPDVLSPANLKILTPEENEESHELSRKLEEKAEHQPSYRQALKNLRLSQLDYERRRYAQQIREYYQKRGEPVPQLLKRYVEGIE